ncbi:MAG: PDDEXK nuclease domain-containing protein [Nevskia sp.]|nr:PDDEXK nuclease domain-containing protein [Nevskia sp.]
MAGKNEKGRPPSRSAASSSESAPRSRGRTDRGAQFPVAPPRNDVPADYPAWFADLKARIRQERLRVVLASNAMMVNLYWDIGRRILDKQADQGWGSRVIDRLAADLREAFPEMKGLSSRNLKYMRAFAAAWPERTIVQATLAQLPWYHHIALLEKLDSVDTRLWYAAKSLEHGWSRNILALQIQAQAHRRQGKAQTNFPVTLPSPDSDLAVQVFKDPYLFDFLGTDAPRREIELEQGLIEHIQKFLLELGQGFAFVGRQVHLEIGDEDYYLDLLFYHLKLRRYAVIELKARKFQPGDGAQLGMYMTAVDRLLCHPDDKPTLGLLLVREKNRVLVEYALSGSNKPISVAEWDTRLTHALPEELRASLPTIEEIEAELSGVPGSAEPTHAENAEGRRKPRASRRVRTGKS